ncbi:hypothetical protein KCG44_05475 [Pacificimonas sp. WHA3]|uniref:Uncharacterized protein n=1 Tax=Pacificimonas pallii TaxID=2827236 RepID=A0ABS6SEE8_9SPHN|nr:hypothetical protein [Pacificimonas pallii]MBV7256232.1 hypothetical protein [Pacificimonas pallii]
MPDLHTTIVIAATAFACAALISGLAAWSWRGWLELKQAQIARGADAEFGDVPSGNPMNRIEVADLKERVRKLEAIAAGVDL